MPPRGDASVHDMSLLVGQLVGELKGLKEVVEGLNRVWGEREAAATDGRRILHAKIETMAHDLQRVEAVVENVSRDISDTIRPAVESFKTDRDREDGANEKATKISKTFYTVAGLVSGIGGAVLIDLFHKFMK
jgi:hypothetical protein